MGALTVACIETGNYLDRGRLYVDALASMCEAFLPPHRFVCISDGTHSVETIKAEPSLEGWWSKIQLFKPGLLTGEVLYFDLDVVIDGDLGGLVKLLDHGEFWILDDFAWPLSRAAETEALLRQHESPKAVAQLVSLIGGFGTANSSVMLWRDEAGRDIWEQYTFARIAGLHGDQNWITQVMHDRLRLIPQGWARSYRYGGRGPICVFHGSPKPHEVLETWH